MAKKKEVVTEEVAVVCSNCEDSGLTCIVCKNGKDQTDETVV